MNNIALLSFTLEELSESVARILVDFNKKESTLKVNSIEKKEKLYLSSREVAEMCNIKSKTTLWNWKKKGILIPRASAGRKPMYLRSDVLDFLNGVNENSNH